MSNFDLQSRTLALHLYSDLRALCTVQSNHSTASDCSVNGEDGAVNLQRRAPCSLVPIVLLSYGCCHHHYCTIRRDCICATSPSTPKPSPWSFATESPVHLPITTTRFYPRNPGIWPPIGRIPVVPLYFPTRRLLYGYSLVVQSPTELALVSSFSQRSMLLDL